MKVRPVCPTGQLYPLPYQSWDLQSLVFQATTHSILLQMLGNSTDHGTPFRHPPNFTSTICFKLFENNNFTRSLTKAAFPFPVKMLCTITVSSQTILTQTDAWKKNKKIPFYLITPLHFQSVSSLLHKYIMNSLAYPFSKLLSLKMQVLCQAITRTVFYYGSNGELEISNMPGKIPTTLKSREKPAERLGRFGRSTLTVHMTRIIANHNSVTHI